LSCADTATERTPRGDNMSKLRQTDAPTTKKEDKGEAEAMSELTAGKKRFVKRHLTAARPTVWVGKDGASEELLKEIGRQLDKNKMVKVKILKPALVGDEAKQFASNIAEKTESSLVEVRGHTFMLYKHRKK
jgi:RNA-binding protein